ncbi:MAG: hypothetical protein F4Z35_01385 [Dehalococcoidia bacterium]|nr:hypothetical protein [Dehalococcoidia bacterium]
MEVCNLDNWNTQDFIDQPASSPTEDDPWDPLALLERAASSPNTTSLSSNSNLPSQRRREEWTRSAEIQFTPYASQATEDYHDEFGISDDWPEDDFVPDPENELLDEPILTEVFDPDLRSELYGAYDSIDIANVNIRLDLFLSGVDLSDEQDRRVRAYLKTFSRARLSNWLPWLSSRIWTGRTLPLFVEFHAYWESNPEWWESRWYHRRYGWQPRKSQMSNILSRDDAYIIVHRRTDFSPDEMISALWFDEWDYHSLWRYGFWSFASFAGFSAALDDEEEWERLIKWETEREEDVESYGRVVGSEDSRFSVRENSIPTYSHAANLQYWYSVQDWYPKREWHDGLGWSMPSLGTAAPSNTSNPLQGPVWPIGGRNE